MSKLPICCSLSLSSAVPDCLLLHVKYAVFPSPSPLSPGIKDIKRSSRKRETQVDWSGQKLTHREIWKRSRKILPFCAYQWRNLENNRWRERNGHYNRKRVQQWTQGEGIWTWLLNRPKTWHAVQYSANGKNFTFNMSWLATGHVWKLYVYHHHVIWNALLFVLFVVPALFSYTIKENGGATF